MRRIIQLLGATLAFSLSATVLAAPANADPSGIRGPEAAKVEVAVDKLLAQLPDLELELENAAAEPSDLDFGTKPGSAIESNTSAGFSVRFPSNSNRPITLVHGTARRPLTIDLPGVSVPARATESGAVVYEDVEAGTGLLVQAQVDGGVRIMTLIDSADAPSQFSFDLGLGADQRIVTAVDSSAAIINQQEEVVVSIPTPWAYDANGQPVPSRYSVDESALILHVDHGNVDSYPVLADPKFTWGWISGTVYFNRTETAQIAGGMSVMSTGLVSLPTGVTQLIAVQFFAMWMWAFTAVLRGECLKIRWGFTWSWTSMIPGAAPGHYTGSYCR